MNLMVVLLVVGSVTNVIGARILAVFPVQVKSHHVMINAVLRTLAEAGHEVLCFSSRAADEEVANLTVVHMSHFIPAEHAQTREILKSILNKNQVGSLAPILKSGEMYIRKISEEKKLMDLYNSGEKFDLILLETLFAQEALLAMGHKFNAPVINLHTLGAFSVISSASGSPLNLAFIPDFCRSYTDHMSFFQRSVNAYSILSSLFKYYYYYIPELDQHMRQLLNDSSLPHLLDIMRTHLALTFSNSHPYIHYAQPYTTNIQPIGGIHLNREEKPLPEDVKTFLDGSPEGFIYFSVGSIIPEHFHDVEYFNSFLSAFRRLPQRVLWKTNRDLKALPENVKTSKWVPQQDVLAHPNVRVFITHGGMFSQHEAIHAAVPVICTPYAADQPMNAKFYEEKGIGVVLSLHTLCEETILSALTTVLGDSRYRDNMARMSRIYRDRPLSPADTLLYWVEYVIRHGGAPHLRPASADMPFYQLYLLDVVGTVLITFIIASLMIYMAVKRISGIILNKYYYPYEKSKKYN